MKLSFTPYELQLRHTFAISGHSRTTTPAVIVAIHHDNINGYGEASLPPYLGETGGSVIEFLRKIDLSQFDDPTQIDDILQYIDSRAPGNTAAKASLDIALHDLVGKITNTPCYKMYGIDPDTNTIPNTTFTIGIDPDAEVIRNKTREAADRFRLLKVKVGSADDRRTIDVIRSVTDLPLAVDANQGWTDKHEALDKINWLAEQGVVMIEQPMPKHSLDQMAWLTERSPLPIFADESMQRLDDVQRLKGAVSGINIKLMKCTGMREAWRMRTLAQQLGMKVMIGCMTETSCAISAAAHLSYGLDFADLDGALLITNDCFDGATLCDGKIIPADRPGIGAMLRNCSDFYEYVD